MPHPSLLWPPLETIRQSLCLGLPATLAPNDAHTAPCADLRATADAAPARNRPDPFTPLQEYAHRQQAFREHEFAPGLWAGRLVRVQFTDYALTCLLDAPEKNGGEDDASVAWRCFVVTPECDWAGRYDVLLEPEDAPFHPICGMVQAWHMIVAPLDPRASILGELSPQRMAAIRAVREEYIHAQSAADANTIADGDVSTSRPGLIALRSVGPHTVLTGSALADDDPRLHYQALYREHARELLARLARAQEAQTQAQAQVAQALAASAQPSSPSRARPAQPFSSTLSAWFKKGRDWFSADWLVRPAFAVLCLLFAGQMLLPEHAALLDDDIRFRGAAPGETLTVHWRRDASSQAITQALSETGATIIHGPDIHQDYILHAADLAALAARLQASGLTEKIETTSDQPG